MINTRGRSGRGRHRMRTEEAGANLLSVFQKNMYWIIGGSLAILFLIFTEGSLIVATKLFGVMKATLLRVLVTIPFSWAVIYLSTKTNRSYQLSNWLAKREARLSKYARMTVEGGKFLVVLNVAIFFGPIVASILMLMIGLKAKMVYFYAVLCALLSAWLWSAFYSGMLWGVGKVLLLI